MNEISSVMLKVFHGHSRQTRVLSLFVSSSLMITLSVCLSTLHRYRTIPLLDTIKIQGFNHSALSLALLNYLIEIQYSMSLSMIKCGEFSI